MTLAWYSCEEETQWFEVTIFLEIKMTGIIQPLPFCDSVIALELQ